MVVEVYIVEAAALCSKLVAAGSCNKMSKEYHRNIQVASNSKPVGRNNIQVVVEKRRWAESNSDT